MSPPSTNGLAPTADAAANGVVEDVVVEDLATKAIGIDDVKEKDAYIANYRAHKKGISHEEMVKAYSEWANNYDKDLCPGVYNGPEIAGDALASYYAEEVRPEISILDVAAGTGRVGHELHKRGFRQIDALEPSSGMLKVLMGRGVYGKSYETAIGYEREVSIPSNSYDSLVIAGGMGEGHIPVRAVDEMIRIVKKGGTIFIVMREEYLAYVEEYVGKLEPYMNSLEEKGYWKKISRTIVPEYSFEKNGVVYNYQVLSDSENGTHDA